jgi:hypothetical protein
MERVTPKKGREAARILDDPVLWGETYLQNRNGGPRRYWPHQKQDLRCADKSIIHLDGRDTGKTVSLTTLALHYAFTKFGASLLIAAPHQGHLESIIEEIEFQLDSSPDLQASIALTPQGRPKIIRKPYFKIEISTGSVIYFRPAGAYGDAFRSLHVNVILVDEGAWLPEKAWKALRQCLKADGIFRIYSTPNGLRDTTYYRLTQSDRWLVFRWPSWLHPDWTDNRGKDLDEFYGGKDSAGWQHEVAGEHGRPSYGAFNIEYFTLSLHELPEYQKISITGEELRYCESEEEVEERLDMLLNLVHQDGGTFWLGADTGYTNDPTEIVIFKETEEHGRTKLRLVLRIHMEHVSYPNIAACLGLLDRYYDFAGMGIDNGGNGVSVAQELTGLDKYRPLGLKDRLRGFDFGSNTMVYQEENGKEVKKQTKEYMTSLINKSLQKREMVLPIDDLDIESQFTTHTYSFQSSGRVKYSKGNDHIIDSVRCALMVRNRFEDEDCIGVVNVPPLIPLLTDPIFW